MNNQEQAKQYLEDIENRNYKKYDEIMDFVYNFQSETGADFGIVTAEDLDYMVEQQSKDGFARVACLLAKVNTLHEPYYHIDGYGNAEDYNFADVKMYLEDIARGYYD